MDRNNHSGGISVILSPAPARNQEEKNPSKAVYTLKIKMTKSQIQIKLEKLVIQSSSFISLRQKYIGYSNRTVSIYSPYTERNNWLPALVNMHSQMLNEMLAGNIDY